MNSQIEGKLAGAGSARKSKEDDAIHAALLKAQADLSRWLSRRLIDVSNSYLQRYERDAGHSTDVDSFADDLADECVPDARQARVKTFVRSTGEFDAYVLLQLDPKGMAEGFAARIIERFSPDDGLSHDRTRELADVVSLRLELVSPESNGACCRQNGTCSVTMKSACSGSFWEFGVCDPSPCSSTPNFARPLLMTETSDTTQAAAGIEEKAEEDILNRSAALLNPNGAEATRRAPNTYKANFETTAGDFVLEVTRAWSPRGADRFYNLVNNGFFDDVRFFRVIKGFMAQFGISGDPKVSSVWRNAKIQDDPVRKQNTRGMISFATSGPNTATTQVFINYRNNSRSLDAQGFSPFGKVIEGMEVVDKLHGDYGEGAPRGKGPDQGTIQARGNDYLKASFPNLDYIKKATIVE